MKFLIGIDEVGRGPIAGPVAVGVFVLLNKKAVRTFKGVKESKQLSEKQREKWFEIIGLAKKSGDVDYAVMFESQNVIDSKGISFAIRRAIDRGLQALNIDPSKSVVLLDGGLKAPSQYVDQKTIIKGDEKEVVIALASIAAKVLRDRKMRQWAKSYPGYDLENNKGYGTKKHYRAIRELGLTNIHRKSYVDNIIHWK